MYGDLLYAQGTFADGSPSGLVVDDGKHWSKLCPQKSDWNNLAPDIYSSAGCSEPAAFVPQAQALGAKI